MKIFAIIIAVCVAIFGLVVGGALSWIIVKKAISAYKSNKNNLGFVAIASFFSFLFIFLSGLFLNAFLEALF